MFAQRIASSRPQAEICNECIHPSSRVVCSVSFVLFFTHSSYFCYFPVAHVLAGRVHYQKLWDHLGKRECLDLGSKNSFYFHLTSKKLTNFNYIGLLELQHMLRVCYFVYTFFE